MHSLLDTYLEHHHGLVRAGRRRPPGLPRWAVANAVREGRLVRFLPAVYGVPTADPIRAAGLYVDGHGGLSHTTALAVWRLWPRTSDIHVTVLPRCRLRASGLSVHVRDSLVVGPPDIAWRDDLPVTSMDDTIVAAWPLLPDGDRTAVLIRSVGDGLTTPARLAGAIHRSQRVTDRVDLVRLVGKLASGCRSYLELFGLDEVFRGLALDRQVPIVAGGQRYYLDLYARDEKVNVELDGAAFHGSGPRREADVQRDAALATRGILVVRFTYRTVMRDPIGVRREVLQILDTRR